MPVADTNWLCFPEYDHTINEGKKEVGPKTKRVPAHADTRSESPTFSACG